jgi:GNAT superfamily N-acetyltransferase
VNKIDGIIFRDACSDDAAVILAVLRAAFEEYEGALDPPSGAHYETVDTVSHRLSMGGAVLAAVDGAPVGFAFYEPQEELLYFGRLSVLPNFRNNGIGRALLEHVERRASATGAAGIRLGVRLQLPHLIARYERLGYRITKYMTHKGYSKPTFVYMEKRF